MTTPNPAGNDAKADAQGSQAIGGNVGGNVTAKTTIINLPEAVPPEKWLHQLPSPLPGKKFVGRGRERAQIKRILNAADHGKVALTALKGMGGVGKTELAVFVANQIKDKFPDAQLFIRLHGTTPSPAQPIAVLQNVILTLQPGAQLPADLTALEAAYRSVLAGKKILLVLDNARDVAQIRPLLPPAGCGLIITSRNALITLTEVETLSLDILTEEESVGLLRTLVPTRGSDDDLKRVAKLCGYLPLALNVAGSMLSRPEWEPREYIVILEQERVKRLKVEDDESKDVETVLAFSAAQLVRDDANLAAKWQMLSVFPADFDEDAAVAVLAVERTDAKDALSKLLDRHLVMFDENNRRYRLHDLLREIAAKVFDRGATHPLGVSSAQRLTDAAKRHAEYYDRYFSPMSGGFQNKETAQVALEKLQWFKRERANVMCAMAWAKDHVNLLPQSTLTFKELSEQGTHGSIAVKSIQFVDWMLLNADKLASNPLVPTPELGAVYLGMGAAMILAGKTESATKHFERGIAIYKALHDPVNDPSGFALQEQVTAVLKRFGLDPEGPFGSAFALLGSLTKDT
jgi:hypothetical protein